MSIDGSTTGRISMSQPEHDVLKVMHQVLAGTLTQVEAARLLRLGGYTESGPKLIFTQPCVVLSRT